MKKLDCLKMIMSLVLFFGGFLASSSFGQTGPSGNLTPKIADVKIEKEILLLEEAGRKKALAGESNWDDLIAEDAYMIAFDGSIIHYKKNQNLPSVPLKTFELSEMIVRIYGKDTAIVTGLANASSESADKKSYAFQMRFLNVWKKTGDSWKIVVSERTGVKPTAK